MTALANQRTSGAKRVRRDLAALKQAAAGRQTVVRVIVPPENKGSPRIGFQLRRERRVRGLRLKDVADKAGLSQSLISKIENNKTSPSLSTLHRVAKALGS